jgi:tRNA wybutosine-synthesizing protein 4
MLANIARFGASVTSFGGLSWIVGGIIRDELLAESDEICLVNGQGNISRAILSRSNPTPRPLLIGSSVIYTNDSLLVVGGSAVCFSFGTYWNAGFYTLKAVNSQTGGETRALSEELRWRFLHTVAASPTTGFATRMPSGSLANPIVCVPRKRIESAKDFELIVRSASPVILEGLNLGPCTNAWTPEYLKRRIGYDREVSTLNRWLLISRLLILIGCRS